MNVNESTGEVTMTREEFLNFYMGYERGDVLGGWIAATVQLGHASPGSTLDYFHPQGEWGADNFIHDFVAWTSGRKGMAPGCAARLREWGAEEARLRMDDFTRRHGLFQPKQTEERAS